MKNEDLITIAIKLADTIRKSAKPDWAVRENLRASMRLKIKKILSRSGYPPDKTDEAIKYVVEQAERIAYR
jgi:type I restriction enzyme R subunit